MSALPQKTRSQMHMQDHAIANPTQFVLNAHGAKFDITYPGGHEASTTKHRLFNICVAAYH